MHIIVASWAMFFTYKTEETFNYKSKSYAMRLRLNYESTISSTKQLFYLF